jgi:glycosyltransferase involved in cell wall biosynthesis
MNKPIHIVHIISALTFGGAERFVVDLINNSDKEKFRFSIITTRDENPLQAQIKRGDVNIEVIEKKGKISFGLFSAIKNKLQELQPDIVHTNLFVGDFWGRVATCKLSLPTITTEHNVNIGESWLHGFIKRKMRNKSLFYTCPSVAIKNYLKKYYKIKKPTEVIRYGIELDKFLAIPEIDLSGPIKFFMLGRLTKQKGHKIALQALSQLKDGNWQLTIVGDGELENEIKDEIKNLGLQDRVKMEPATSNVVSVFKKNDIMLMPSLWEGLGIVIMESFASGRLVIGSEVGGIPELIREGQTGYLVESDSVDSLVEKIKWCLENLSDCKKVAKTARREAEENFGAKEMATKYEKIYLDIVNKKYE